MQLIICAEAPLQLPRLHMAIFDMDGLPLPTAMRLLHHLIPQVLQALCIGYCVDGTTISSCAARCMQRFR